MCGSINVPALSPSNFLDLKKTRLRIRTTTLNSLTLILIAFVHAVRRDSDMNVCRTCCRLGQHKDDNGWHTHITVDGRNLLCSLTHCIFTFLFLLFNSHTDCLRLAQIAFAFFPFRSRSHCSPCLPISFSPSPVLPLAFGPKTRE